jgi:glycosyltransferase involved in cell wall biosynthesis
LIDQGPIQVIKQRIGLVSSAVPHIFGGGRFIVEWLGTMLRAGGHEVEVVFVPSIDDPDNILEQMVAFRSMNFDDFDTVVTFRPPSHLIRHRRKICWFIHHIRVFYDLWETQYNPWPDTAQMRAIRDAIRRFDGIALREAYKCYALSGVVAQRMRTYNGIEPDVLYAPLLDTHLFRCDGYRDEIVCVSRVEDHKRQHLLIEAMKYVDSNVHLKLSGTSSSPTYAARLAQMIRDQGLENKVTFDHRWISEQEKADLLATCLASAYVPFDEDYGYPTLEAAYAQKCTVTARDSGGVSELVAHGSTGYVVEPNPKAIAQVFDALYRDQDSCARMGRAAKERMSEIGINWPTVFQRLLS